MIFDVPRVDLYFTEGDEDVSEIDWLVLKLIVWGPECKQLNGIPSALGVKCLGITHANFSNVKDVALIIDYHASLLRVNVFFTPHYNYNKYL